MSGARDDAIHAIRSRGGWLRIARHDGGMRSAGQNGFWRVLHTILILYGSYRADRQGIRLADYLVRAYAARGDRPELVDARAVGLPMLDRMYKEYPKGEARAALQGLASKIRAADGVVVGEYNRGVQPGLKNLTDHFLEEWFWKPVAVAWGRRRLLC